jgi:hypothetical protein
MANVLRAFLSPTELAELRERSRVADGWTPGRQGTGYDILPLAWPDHPLVVRALGQLGTPFEHHWDVYLIRYLDGAHIPAHTDPAQYGKRHRRINAVVTQASAGGDLRIDGALVELTTGDAVVFYPDAEVHEVTPVIGIRVLFSVGAWLA